MKKFNMDEHIHERITAIISDIDRYNRDLNRYPDKDNNKEIMIPKLNEVRNKLQEIINENKA